MRRVGILSSLHLPWRAHRSGDTLTQTIMDKNDGFMKALKCRECGREYPLAATHVCEFDFGPLEVVYDYDLIKEVMTRETIQSRAQTMWRYRELLPDRKSVVW